MTDAIDLERMMVTIEGETTRLERDFSKAVSIVNTYSDKMERRTDQLKTKIETQFSQAGSNAARRLTGALAAGLSFAAIEQFVSHIATTTENIEKQSRALGMSTDAFQAWSLSAKHASIDQDSLNTALDFFSKNIGLAQLKTTPFGQIMKKLGVDIHAGPEAALFQFTDALNKIASPQQRNAVLTMAMGRSSVQMAAMLGQGSDALRKQAAEFKANGEIIDKEAIEKINKLRVAWSDVKAEFTSAGANVLRGFADDFARFAGGVESPAFQSSMKQLGSALSEVAKWAIAIGNSPWFKYIAAAGAGGMVAGLPGAIAGASGLAIYKNLTDLGVRAPPTNAADAKTQLTEIQKHLDAARTDDKNPLSFLGKSLSQNLGDVILQNTGPDSDIGKWLGGHGTTQQLTQQRDAMRRWMQHLQGQEAKNAPPSVAGTPTGSIDLSGTLDKAKGGGGAAKVSQYAKAVADLITKTNELAKADDDSTASSSFAEAKTRLLDAARSDGVKITKATTDGTNALGKSINDLAKAYAVANATRAFSKDLVTEDDRISKLKAEEQQAYRSAAAIAELEEREKLLSDFRDKFGKNAVPTPAQQTDIDTRAKAFGAATGADAFSKNVKAAQDENKALSDQIATVGTYGGALAEAQMRLTLVNQAMQANGTVSAEDLAKISALAKAHGELTKQLQDEQLAEQNRVAIEDQLRTGLEDTAIAGVHSFKSLGDAAKQFAIDLLDLALRLYVLRPLLTDLFGQQGTSGGGLFGSLLNGILGSSGSSLGSMTTPGGVMQFSDMPLTFADGGIMTSRGKVPLRKYAGGGVANSPQMAMWGEAGPEAFVPLKNGGIPVHLKLPSVNASRSAPPITVQNTFQVDARYATEGTAQMIDSRLRVMAPAISEATVRRVRAEFPDNLRRTLRDRG